MQCRTDGRGIECSNRPKTVELCGDLIDNDCNGATDEGVDVNGDGVISIDESFDKDGDGVQACDCAEGQCSLKTLVVDCNDNDKDVYPAFDGKEAALEICDGKDNDCNGLTDEDTGKSKSRDQYSGEAWENKITWDEDKNVPLDRNGNAFFCDYDEDGFLWNGRIDRDTGEAIEIDCNDYDNEIYPGSYEKCDGKDNDCNGSVDEKSDLDKDGYKSCRSLCPGNNDGTEICDADCDDTRATVHPGTIEVCNAIDDNCDGIVDEGFILLGKDDKPVLNEENGLIYNHLNHCGACNNRCKVFNVKNAICDNGFCSYDECKEGFIDLDGDRTNGCEQSVECDYAVLGASCLSIGRECYKPMYPSENGTQSHCRCEGVWTYLMDDKGNGSVKCIVNDENEGEIIPPAACAVAQRNGMLPELCNGEDDNCDGRIDEDFWGADGKLSTIENCGACGVKCNFDQVNPETGEIESAHVDAYACIDGQCAIDVTKENKGCAKGYVNGDRIDANGCELACTPTEKAKLDSLDDTCDGIDDNCDGQIDEHAECNDNLHCGNFETSCESKHGRRYCLKTIEGYVCQEDGCNDGYGECISTDDEYCETDVTTPVNCGKCGEVCPSSTDTCSCADGAETCRNRDRICTCGKEGGECSGAKPFCHNGECYECTTDDDCFKPDIQRSIAGGVDPVTPIPAYCSNYVCHTCVRGDPFDAQHNGKYVCDPLSDKPICRRSIRSGMTWYSCGGCQTRFECSEVAEKAEVVEITDLPEKTPEGKSGLTEWSLWLKRNGFCETEPCCSAAPEGEASEESEAEPCPAALAPADQNQILDRNALVKQYKQLILSQGICNPVQTNISDDGEVEGTSGGNCVQCIRKGKGQYDGCPENAPICASVEQGEDGPTHCVPCVSGNSTNSDDACPNGLSCSNGKCIGCGDDFNGCKDTPSTPICGYSGMKKEEVEKLYVEQCASSDSDAGTSTDSDAGTSTSTECACISTQEGLVGLLGHINTSAQCEIEIGENKTSVTQWKILNPEYIQYDGDHKQDIHFHFAEFSSSSERACRACWFNEDCALRAEVLPNESKPKQFEFQCVSGRCQVCNPFTNDGCQGNEICGCDPNSSACSKYECIPASMAHCSALGVGCDVDTANECVGRHCKCGNESYSEVCGGHYPFCLWDKWNKEFGYQEIPCEATDEVSCLSGSGKSKSIKCSRKTAQTPELHEFHTCNMRQLCKSYCDTLCTCSGETNENCDCTKCPDSCMADRKVVENNENVITRSIGENLVDACANGWKQASQDAKSWCNACCPKGDEACVANCESEACVVNFMSAESTDSANGKSIQCCWRGVEQKAQNYIWKEELCNTPRCVNCRTDEDCHGGDICVAHECRACQPFEADQSNDTGATPLVSQEQKNCSPESAAPICDSESFTCRACSTDTECIYASGGALGYCNHTLGRCQVCNPADSKGCSAEKPICNLTPNGYACAVCENSEECNARSAGLICSSGKCEACESSANCRKKQDNWVHPNGSVCIGTGSAKHCGKCEKDDDCSASGNDGQFCFDGACVECRSNSDCATNANGNVCKNHVCGGCDDASDCEGHDAGSYCTATKSGLSICAPCNKEHGGCSEQNPICAEKTLTADNGQEYHSFACDTCDENEHSVNNDGTNSSCVARDGGRFPYCNSGICTYCNEAQLTGTAHDQGCTDSEPICVLDGKSSGLCRACDASKAECNGMTNAARCTLGNVSCTDGSVPSCKGSEVDSKVVCSAGGVAICTDGKNGTGAPVPDGKPVCVTASACYLGECRECSQQTSLDCGDTKKHACNANGICEPCSSHSDCDHYCSNGRCGECELGINTGCSDAKQPICDETSLKCVACNADVDAETQICADGNLCCPAGLHCLLDGSLKGSCVECVAEGRNAECPEDAPICTAAHQCKVCETDTECDEKAICKDGKCGESGEDCSTDDEGKECIAKNLCVAGRCGTPGVVCHSSDDCDGRVCNPNTHLCQDCFGDDDCLGNGAGQQCVDGVCSQCNPQTHAGCSGRTPICKKGANSLACQACSGDADCATNTSVGNVCKDGECFACFAEQDESHPYDRGCSLQQPVCDGTTNTCRACDSDGECKDYCPTGDCTKEGAQPYCVSLAGGTGMSCHACKPNSAKPDQNVMYDVGCSAGAPICDPYTGTCRGCHSNDDCPASTPFCDNTIKADESYCVACIQGTTHAKYRQHAGCNANQLCIGHGENNASPYCESTSLTQCLPDGKNCNTDNTDSADHCVNRTCVCGDTGAACSGSTPHCVSVSCKDGTTPYCKGSDGKPVDNATLSCGAATVTCSSGTPSCGLNIGSDLTPECKSVCSQCRDNKDCGGEQRCENGSCVDIALANCTNQGVACNENTANKCDAGNHDGKCKCGSEDACSGYCVQSNDDTYHCVTCISNSDCKDGNANKLCNAAGNCVACTAGQACSDCASDTDCQNGTTKWFCDPGDNHCHECVSDVDNGVVDGVSPACTTGDAQCVNGEVTCSDAIGTAYCTTGSPSCDAGKPVCVQKQCVNHTWQVCDPNGDVGCETAKAARTYSDATCSGRTATCIGNAATCQATPSCTSNAALTCRNGKPICIAEDSISDATCASGTVALCLNNEVPTCQLTPTCQDGAQLKNNAGVPTCVTQSGDGSGTKANCTEGVAIYIDGVAVCEVTPNCGTTGDLLCVDGTPKCVQNDLFNTQYCDDTKSVYECATKSGYDGQHKPCSEYPCYTDENAQGELLNSQISCHVDYTGTKICACNDAVTGYTLNASGDACVNIDECAIHTDLCHCDPSRTSEDCEASCKDKTGKVAESKDANGNTIGAPLGYICECSAGYRLENPESLASTTCVDIDECKDNSTKIPDNATCVNTLGGYTWKCNPGYTKSANGELCVDINECALGTHTCPPSLHCLNNEGGFTCKECTSSEHCSASEKGSYCSTSQLLPYQCTCVVATNEGCGGDWKCMGENDSDEFGTCKDCNVNASCKPCLDDAGKVVANTCEDGEYCNALGYCDNRTGCENQADCERSGTSNDKGNSQLYCYKMGTEHLCVECLYPGHCASIEYTHNTNNSVTASDGYHFSETSANSELAVRSKNGAEVITITDADNNSIKKDIYPKDGCVATQNNSGQMINSDQMMCGCYKDGDCQSGYVCRRDPGDSTTAYSHCVECNTADDCAYKVGKPGEGCVNHKCEPLENLSESCHEVTYGVGANAYKISTHSACNGEKRKFCATAEGKSYCVECSGNTRLLNNDLVSMECGHGENDSGLMCRVDDLTLTNPNPESISTATHLKSAYCGCKDAYSCAIGGCKYIENKYTCKTCSAPSDCVYAERRLQADGSFDVSFEAYGVCDEGACSRCNVTGGYSESNKYDNGCFYSDDSHYDSNRPVCTTASNGASAILACSECEPYDFNGTDGYVNNGPDCTQNKHCIVRNDNASTGIYTCESCDAGYYRTPGTLNSACHMAEPTFGASLAYRRESIESTSADIASVSTTGDHVDVAATITGIPEVFGNTNLLTLSPVCTLQNAPVGFNETATTRITLDNTEIACHIGSLTYETMSGSTPLCSSENEHITYSCSNGGIPKCVSTGVTTGIEANALADATGCSAGVVTCEANKQAVCVKETSVFKLPMTTYIAQAAASCTGETLPSCEVGSELKCVPSDKVSGILISDDLADASCSCGDDHQLACVSEAANYFTFEDNTFQFLPWPADASKQAHINQVREYMGGLTCDVSFTCVNSTPGISAEASPSETLSVTMTFVESNDPPVMTWTAPSEPTAHGTWEGSYIINGVYNDETISFVSKVNDKDLGWAHSKDDSLFTKTPRGLQWLEYTKEGCNVAEVGIPSGKIYINKDANSAGNTDEAEADAIVGYLDDVNHALATSNITVNCKDKTDTYGNAPSNCSLDITVTDEMNGEATFPLTVNCATCINNETGSGDRHLHSSKSDRGCPSSESADRSTYRYCTGEGSNLACSQCNGTADGFAAISTAGDANTGINSTCGANSRCTANNTTHVFTCGCIDGYSDASDANTDCAVDLARFTAITGQRQRTSSDSIVDLSITPTWRDNGFGTGSTATAYAIEGDNSLTLTPTCELIQNHTKSGTHVVGTGTQEIDAVVEFYAAGAASSTASVLTKDTDYTWNGTLFTFIKKTSGTYTVTFRCDNTSANQKTKGNTEVSGNDNDKEASHAELTVTVYVNDVPSVTASPTVITHAHSQAETVTATVTHAATGADNGMALSWQDDNACNGIATLGNFGTSGNLIQTADATCQATNDRTANGKNCTAHVHANDGFSGGLNGEADTENISITCKYCIPWNATESNKNEGCDQTSDNKFCTTYNEKTYAVSDKSVTCASSNANCGEGTTPKCAPTSQSLVWASDLKDVACSEATPSCADAGYSPVCVTEESTDVGHLACSSCAETSDCSTNAICAAVGNGPTYTCSNAELSVSGTGLSGSTSWTTNQNTNVITSKTSTAQDLTLTPTCDLTNGVQGTRSLSANVKFTPVAGGESATKPEWTTASGTSFTDSGSCPSGSSCWTSAALVNTNNGKVKDTLTFDHSEAGTYTVDFTCDNGGSTPRTYATGSVTIYVNGVPHVTFASNSGPGSLSGNTLTLTSGMAATTVKVLHGHGANIGTDDSTDPATDVEVGSLKYEYDVCVVTDDTNVSDACPAPSASPSPAPPANGSNTINPPANIPASGSSSDSDPTPSSAPANADESAMVPKQETPGSPG